MILKSPTKMMKVALLCVVVRVLSVRFQGRRVSHTLKISMLGVLTTLLIAACSGNAANHSTSTPNRADPALKSSDSQCQFFPHKLGKTRVCGQPQKVVALNEHMLEILLALQVQPAGYAESFPFHRGDFDRPSQQIPYLGSRVTSQPINVGVNGQPSLEKLLQLKPDLILGPIGQNQNKYTLLSQIAPTLLFDGFRVGEWQQSIQVIAKALGRTEQAQEVIELYNQRLAATRQELAPVVAAHPKVLMLVSDRLNQNLQIANSNDPCNHLVKELGFQLVLLPGKEQLFPVQKISLEILPQLDSDLILVQAYNIDRQADQFAEAKQIENYQLKSVKQEWNNNALAQSMRASKQGRVYFIPSYVCYGFPGPIGAELLFNQLSQQLLPPSLKSQTSAQDGDF